jgi:hypothetical protein
VTAIEHSDQVTDAISADLSGSNLESTQSSIEPDRSKILDRRRPSLLSYRTSLSMPSEWECWNIYGQHTHRDISHVGHDGSNHIGLWPDDTGNSPTCRQLQRKRARGFWNDIL